MSVSAQEAQQLGKGDANSEPTDQDVLIAGSSDPTAPNANDIAARITGTNQFASPGNVTLPGLRVGVPIIPGTSPVPQVNLAPPGSFAEKFSNAFKNIAAGGHLGDFSSIAVAAGLHAAGGGSGAATPAGAPQSAVEHGGSGNVDWATASKSDQTAPINPQQVPVENRAHQIQRGIFSTLGGLFDLGTSAADMGKRMEEENRTNALNSLTNIQMVREQSLLHRQQQETIDKAAQVGKGQFDFMTTAPGAKVIGEGLTSDQIQQGIKSGAYNPHTQQIFQTGRISVGEDKTGNPMYRSTYSVLVPGGEITMGVPEGAAGESLSPKQKEAAEKQEVSRKYINDNVPGVNIAPGQTLPAAQWGALFQQANNIAGMKAAAAASNKKFDDEMEQAELSKQDKIIMANPVVANAIKDNWQHRDDPFYVQKAYLQIKQAIARGDEQAKDLLQKLGAVWEKSFQHAFGNGDQAVWDAKMNQYYAAQQKSQDALDKVLTDPKYMAEHADAVPALTQVPMKTAADSMRGAQQAVDQATAVLNDPKNQGPEAAEIRQKAQNDIEKAKQVYAANKDRFDQLQTATNTANQITKNKKDIAAGKSGAEEAARSAAKNSAEKTQATVANYNKTIDQNQKLLADPFSTLSTAEKKDLQDQTNDLRARRDAALGINHQTPVVVPPTAPQGTAFIVWDKSHTTQYYTDKDHNVLGPVKQ